MGWVMMSERDLNRVEVLAQIDDGQISVDTGANILALTRRQVDLSRFCAAPSARLSHFPFGSDGAFPTQY